MRPISMIRTGAALSLLALGLGASCSGKGSKEGPGTAPDPAPAVQRPRPTARIVAVTDLQGTLEPCGCTSRPLGGIDKLAAQVERLRQDGVPTAFVAAGNLLFDGVDHGAGHSGKAGDGLPTQELWKAETLASILGTIGLDA
ncbi:MAG: hypothetical protein KC416_01515, partial [Myxococcales bacterium]|nr:hypothetical protein [Myxococcales bacterium]